MVAKRIRKIAKNKHDYKMLKRAYAEKKIHFKDKEGEE